MVLVSRGPLHPAGPWSRRSRAGQSSSKSVVLARARAVGSLGPSDDQSIQAWRPRRAGDPPRPCACVEAGHRIRAEGRRRRRPLHRAGINIARQFLVCPHRPPEGRRRATTGCRAGVSTTSTFAVVSMRSLKVNSSRARARELLGPSDRPATKVWRPHGPVARAISILSRRRSSKPLFWQPSPGPA